MGLERHSRKKILILESKSSVSSLLSLSLSLSIYIYIWSAFMIEYLDLRWMM
jgi:hypothetical protein